MKPNPLFRLALMALLLAPSLCFAELTAYQKTVVATFQTSGNSAPLAAAYEAANAGKATPVQKTIVRNSELIHEDLVLNSCVRPNLGEGVSLDDAIGKVVAAGQGPALVASTKALFQSSEWQAGIPAEGSASEQTMAAAVMLASGARMDASTTGAQATQALRRRLTLNYYLSFATDGKCKPTTQAKALVAKGKA
jgi:hypothetical protein